MPFINRMVMMELMFEFRIRNVQTCIEFSFCFSSHSMQVLICLAIDDKIAAQHKLRTRKFLKKISQFCYTLQR